MEEMPTKRMVFTLLVKVILSMTLFLTIVVFGSSLDVQPFFKFLRDNLDQVFLSSIIASVATVLILGFRRLFRTYRHARSPVRAATISIVYMLVLTVSILAAALISLVFMFYLDVIAPQLIDESSSVPLIVQSLFMCAGAVIVERVFQHKFIQRKQLR